MKLLNVLLLLVLFAGINAIIINIPEDFPAIQEGIDFATNGDTVLVSPGVYSEQLDFEGKDITVASLFLTTGNISHISQTTITHPYFPLVRFDSGESSSALLRGFTLTSANVAILCHNNSNPTLSYLNISENCANFLGCGIYCDNSSPHIANCTIANNELLEPNPHGGGVFARDNSHPILVNSIVWNNTTPQISLWHPGGDQPSSITIAYCDIEGGEQGIEINDGTINWLQGNIDIDPLFVHPPSGDYNLQLESPCIDSGTSFFMLDDDIVVSMDSTQYVGTAPDMGSFEYDPDSEISENDLFPKEYLLHQNYPNPFNPLTTINYQLPEICNVKLCIFDIKGRLIKTLVDEIQQSGNHEIEWTGRNFNDKLVSSGIYFTRLVTRYNILTKRMVLLK